MEENKIENIEKIKEKIAKLQKITSDPAAAENEAMMATKKMQDLLLKYHLELNDINSEDNINKPVLNEPILSKKRFMWYDEMLISILSKYFMVSVYKQRNRVINETVIHCIGYKEDIIIFKSIFGYLSNVMKNIYTKNSKTLDRNQFYRGFMDSINRCLKENQNKNKEKWDIVLCKDYLSVETSKLNIKKSSSNGIKPKFSNDMTSYSKGFKEGKEAYKEYGSNNKLTD